GDNESRLAYSQALKDYFSKYEDELCPDCRNRLVKNPLRILDCKIDRDKDFVKNAPRMTDYLTDEARQYFEKVKEYLNAMEIPFEVDDGLVRGLDYYTDTVFEVVSTHAEAGAQATVFAGGRYDELIKEMGGPSLSGVGFAVGLERLLIMAKAEDVLAESDEHIDCYVIDMTGSSTYAFRVAEQLRKNFYSTQLNFYQRSMKSQFKSVDRNRALYTLIIGEDELKNETVTIKDNISKEQYSVPFTEMTDKIEELEAYHE
ncbi:MAG: ATP phosphoribosyltransferase regulatory subunit, partial [Erysipelotrichaceae bacterium]|nr:ATP phosphoribosyltransferase regulatory subunit [Erysipelotrichaceae bacterium]